MTWWGDPDQDPNRPQTVIVKIEDYIGTIGRLAAHIENVDKKLDRLISLVEKLLQEKANG